MGRIASGRKIQRSSRDLNNNSDPSLRPPLDSAWNRSASTVSLKVQVGGKRVILLLKKYNSSEAQFFFRKKKKKKRVRVPIMLL
jgi:hypothetical protein